MRHCNHRAIIPELIDLVRAGMIDPSRIVTQREPFTSGVVAYRSFDRREPGWVKVRLAA